MEGCSSKELVGETNNPSENFLHEIMQKLCYYCENGVCSIVKEGALACLASVSEAAKKDFEPYFKDIIQALFTMY